MQCPHDMIPMTVKSWRSLHVWRCPACFRGWFPTEHLKDFLKHTSDGLRHLDVWRDPSSFTFRRTVRLCPVDSDTLYRVSEPQSGLAAEMCLEGHGVLVEEPTLLFIGQSVPMPLTAQLAAELPGEEMFNPKQHNHVAVAHVLAHRFLSHTKHFARELARLPA